VNRLQKLLASSVSLSVPALLGGCGAHPASTAYHHAAEDHDHDHHGHAHASEHGSTGPHGGRLIELGHDHKYHAELVNDHSARSVTVYVLDELLNELPIAEETLTLHLNEGDEPRSFELRAESDGEQAAYSRFTSSEGDLLTMLAEQPNVIGKLRVRIDGVPYIGRIAAHDDHEHRH
jgi:hypothetical protein